MPHMTPEELLARAKFVLQWHSDCGCAICLNGPVLLREMQAALNPNFSDEELWRLHPHAAPPAMPFVDPTGPSVRAN